MQSRGGVTGGLTISDVLREFDTRGYVGQFAARSGGLMECLTCGHQLPPNEVLMESMRRIEGVSDPADMCIIGAMECPSCQARGTATLCYGPHCPPEDAEVLRRIDDMRPSQALNERFDDHSLVSDTGWIERGM